ncbi:hypothetical protein, partial [Dubosiella newyorkensis]
EGSWLSACKNRTLPVLEKTRKCMLSGLLLCFNRNDHGIKFDDLSWIFKKEAFLKAMLKEWLLFLFHNSL